MKKSRSFAKKLKKICTVFLIITLILGILSSSFGITVVALHKEDTPSTVTDIEPSEKEQNVDTNEVYKAPTEDYPDLKNEVSLNDNVSVLTTAESSSINSSIVAVETKESYSGDYVTITLNGENHNALKNLSSGDIFYLQGDANTPFGGDRIFSLENYRTVNGKTYIEASEPYFEDVFNSMEICSSDLLTEDNFETAYYAEGVSSYFGDVETDILNASDNSDDVTVEAISTNANNKINKPIQTTKTASDSSFTKRDLIIEIDWDCSKKGTDDEKDKNEKDKNEKEKNKNDDPIDKSYGIKGRFGIKDLTAHLVCDMPKPADFQEFYLGLSGETFLDVDVYGKISAKAEMEAKKIDNALFSLEGLNQKRFPIAVFKFQGTTPVYITNAAYEKGLDSILPSLYIILYSDWEGNISLELNGGFEYSHSFNNGLRVFKDGKPCLSFESYPYEKSYDVQAEDGFAWEANLKLEADTDLTLLGGSVLFYVAGINLGEFSVARLGVEAKCNISITANSKEGLKVAASDDTELYIRGYLKLIEVKIKLKADGKSFLDNLSIDINFEFTLLDLTMFEHGVKPDKFKPKVPISSISAPTEFESVLTLVCDVSGSMDSSIDTGQTKLEAAKEAANVIVTSTESWANSYNGNYGIGVTMFSSHATTVAVPHIDYKYIKECIASMSGGGGTSIYEGIDSGITQLDAVKSTNKVMILMTDGQDSNVNEARQSAQNAASKNIQIYTIGFGEDVSEDILKEIAETTGGEYRYANTDNIVGIIGSFMYAQQASNADVLTEIEDTVGEGETSEPSEFTVDDKSGTLTASTAWPGSFLDTILIDPNGREVDDKYPGAVTDETKIPSTITVTNPLQGKWTIKVKGIETSYAQEPFYTIVSFKETQDTIINKAMNQSEHVASYCIPIGLFVALVSGMLLLCLCKKTKVK